MPSIAATTAPTSLVMTPTASPFSRPRQNQGPLSVSPPRLLSHDQSLSSPAPVRSRAIDQSNPPIPHGSPHLALSQAVSHVRSRLAGPVRFKSPAIQDDAHLLVVLRYIEANPLRAKMVTDPAEYRWSSFLCQGSGQDDPLLSPFPEWEELGETDADRRRPWRAKVCAAQSEAELMTVRGALRAADHSGPRNGPNRWPSD